MTDPAEMQRLAEAAREAQANSAAAWEEYVSKRLGPDGDAAHQKYQHSLREVSSTTSAWKDAGGVVGEEARND